MKNGGDSVHQFVVTKTSCFMNFFKFQFFLISCVWENACKVEFQIMKVYIENYTFGEKLRIKVNPIISQFKSQLI